MRKERSVLFSFWTLLCVFLTFFCEYASATKDFNDIIADVSRGKFDFSVEASPIISPETVGSEILTAGSSYCIEFSNHNYISLSPKVQTHVQVAQSMFKKMIKNVTFAAWIKPEDITGATPVIGFPNESGPQLYLSKNSAGKTIVNSFNDWALNSKKICQPLGHATVPDINDGEWHHVALTFNQETFYIYVDGEIFETCSFDHSQYTWIESETLGQELIIGGARFDTFYKGHMDEVRVYARYLEPQEVGLIYKYSINLDVGTVDFHAQKMIAGFSFSSKELEDNTDYVNSAIEVHFVAGRTAQPKITTSSSPICGKVLSQNLPTVNLDNPSVSRISFTPCALLHPHTNINNIEEVPRFHLQSLFINYFNFSNATGKVVTDPNLELGLLEIENSKRNVSITIDVYNLTLANDVSFNFYPSELIGSLEINVDLIHAGFRETMVLGVAMVENTKPEIGTSGSAIDCDGVDDFLFNADFEWPLHWYKKSNGEDIYGSGPVTIEGWIFIQENKNKTTGGALFSIGNGERASSWVDIYSPYRKTGRFWVGVDENFEAHIGSLSITEKDLSSYYDTWVHFSFGHEQASGNQTFLYLNGELVDRSFQDHYGVGTNVTIDWEMTPFDPLKLIKSLSICTWSFWSETYHQGAIDEFKIWDHIRTQDQVLESMNNRLIGNETGLLGYWDFDDDDKYIAKDKTENGHDLVAGGCAPCTDYYKGYSKTRFSQTGDEESSKVCLPSAQSSSGLYYEREEVFGGFHCYNHDNKNTFNPKAIPARIVSYAPVTGYNFQQNTISGKSIDIKLNYTDKDGDSLSVVFLKVADGGILSNMDTVIRNMHTLDLSSVKYTPHLSFGGTSNFSFYVTDGLTKSDIATINILVECLPGSFLENHSNNCTLCPKGTYIDAPSLRSQCLPCPIHTYAPETGATICKPCPEEFYVSSNKTGNSVCQACSENWSDQYSDTELDGRCPISRVFNNRIDAAALSIPVFESNTINNGTRALVTSFSPFGNLFDENQRSFRPGFLLTNTVQLPAFQVLDVSHNVSEFVYNCTNQDVNDVCRSSEEFLREKGFDPRGILGDPLTTESSWLAKSSLPVTITFTIEKPLYVSALKIYQKQKGAIVSIHALKKTASDQSHWDVLWERKSGNFRTHGVFKPKICPTYYETDTFRFTLNTFLLSAHEISDIYSIIVSGSKNLDDMPLNIISHPEWKIHYLPNSYGQSVDSFRVEIMQCIGRPELATSMTATISSDVVYSLYILPLVYKYIIYVLVSLVIFSLLVIIGVLLYYRNEKRLKRASPLFLCLCILGTIIAFVEIIINTTFVASSGSCVASITLSTVGFSLAFGSLFVITARIKILFNSNAARLEEKRIEDHYLYRDLFVVVLCYGVYLALWFGIDTPVAIEHIEGDQKSYLCQQTPWAYGLLGSQYLLMLFVAVAAYQVRRVPRDFRETQSIMISVYIWLIFSIVPLVINLTVTNIFVISLITTMQICVVYVPMIILIVVYKLILLQIRDETQKQKFRFSMSNRLKSMSESTCKTNRPETPAGGVVGSSRGSSSSINPMKAQSRRVVLIRTDSGEDVTIEESPSSPTMQEKNHDTIEI